MTSRRVALTPHLVEANAQLPAPLTNDLLAQQGATVFLCGRAAIGALSILASACKTGDRSSRVRLH